MEKSERPTIEVRETSDKTSMGPMAPFLKHEWCNYEKPEFLCYPEDGACPCGEYKHHVHCRNCGAIFQTG